MIPAEKVKNIIDKYNSLEKELSSGKFDTKLFAKKSKEYSDLKNIIEIAREYLNSVSYTHLRAHETSLQLVCRLVLEKK